MDIVVAVVLVFVGAFVQTAVGFGLAVIAAPVLFFINPDLVPAPVTVCALVLSLINAWAFRDGVSLQGLKAAVIGRVPGSMAGAGLLLFYTWALKQWGLGELAVLLVWGPLMVGGTHLVTSGGATDADILLPALLFATGPTLVIFGKHLDKLDADRARGMRTLPVRLGEARTRHAIAALVLLQYPLLIALVLTGRLPVPALLMIGAIPTAIPLLRMTRRPRPAERPEHWPEAVWPLWFAAAAFRQARLAGLLLLIGMAGGVLL